MSTIPVKAQRTDPNAPLERHLRRAFPFRALFYFAILPFILVFIVWAMPATFFVILPATAAWAAWGFRKSLQRTDAHYAAHYQLETGDGRAPETFEALRAADVASIDVDNSRNLIGYAIAQKTHGRHDRAIAAFKALDRGRFSFRPRAFNVHVEAAESFALVGELDAAREMSQRALKASKQPNDATLLFTEAVIALRSGDPRTAVQRLEQQWRYAEGTMRATTARTLRVTYAHALAQCGRANSEQFHALMAGAMPATQRDFAWATASWPELGAFVQAHFPEIERPHAHPRQALARPSVPAANIVARKSPIGRKLEPLAWGGVLLMAVSATAVISVLLYVLLMGLLMLKTYDDLKAQRAARYMLQTGKLAEAAQAFEKNAHRAFAIPLRTAATHSYAITAKLQGRHEDAIAVFQTFEKRWYFHAAAPSNRVEIAECYALLGALNPAYEMCQAAAQQSKQPEDARLLFAEAVIMLRSGDPAGAARRIEQRWSRAFGTMRPIAVRTLQLIHALALEQCGESNSELFRTLVIGVGPATAADFRWATTSWPELDNFVRRHIA